MARSIEVIPARRELTNHAASKHRKIRLAVYCRVSTDEEDQLESFENQQIHYRDYAAAHPEYELVGIYADEGITGTNTKKREQFKAMIADCEAGLVDMVITKAISRFARNTADCLHYTRLLRDLGVGVLFEKEAIFTLDGKGELLMTIMSSLAQDESRNISENTSWGIRTRFQRGKMHMNTKRFLGYDSGKDGKLVINKEQAAIVKRIYDEFIDGCTPFSIAERLKSEGVPGVSGTPNWTHAAIEFILKNEKYKGDALLQKYVTDNFLTGRSIVNDGRVAQYYVKGSHPAIVPAEQWDLVQLELKRREDFKKNHGIYTVGRSCEVQSFSNRVYCERCGAPYRRRTWYRLAGEVKIWQCLNMYPKEGKPKCKSATVMEKDLYAAFVSIWNQLVEHREENLPRWEKQREEGSLLERFQAENFIKLTGDGKITEINHRVVTKTLDYVTVKKDGTLVFYLLDGTSHAVEMKK